MTPRAGGIARSKILGGAGPIRQFLFAWCFSRITRWEEKYFAPYKTLLLRGLQGNVLEIGPGSGSNLAYLDPSAVRWIGIEPNAHMHGYLAKTAKSLGIEVDLRSGIAEDLPAPDASVDAVIGTLVLCSVTDQARVLSEIRRVLKPGGKYIFIEHVADTRETWLRRMQKAVTPLWRRIADGCEPARETARAVEEAGFSEVQMVNFTIPVPIVAPHVAGSAVKP